MYRWAILLFVSFQSWGLSLDDSLDVAISAFQLKGNVCDKSSPPDPNNLSSLGKIFFERPILSGDKDISCANCHIDNKALADGLPLAVGVGGIGEDKERLISGGAVVPRNAFTLFARADERYTTFFWDGKVQMADNEIYSPIGEGYSMGFESALSVAAILPLLSRDEFLGHSNGPYNSNSHVELLENQYFNDKVKAQNKFLQDLLKDTNDADIRILVQALNNAEIAKQNFTLSVVGNALASFIREKVKVTCEPSNWEQYINGDKRALTEKQKEGALVFYGKGRCAACHSGDLLSDMNFHSVGVPQGTQGPHMFGQDLGRALVTYRTEDRYKFKTPSLISVSKTAPYGHNGIFPSLESVVKYHINPMFFYRNPKVTDEMILKNNESLASRSEVLRWIKIDEEELVSLLKFLETL
ncbi:methylamine utilization protein MauG [Vibrio zhanjiangensis]|uniref:Methylamine utilization protein MauG n=1 Tax=Vibrio zhanjiangensis TaxID=1046128 RepID=A0ABQ6EV27_9VIBR|nr:His-Xaa-Ser system-associated MauG-like protein [Vibrio zhanjiangensis]GLT16839.1 methylamine utilization protein MauG [Vibrio zhanjiangensis]